MNTCCRDLPMIDTQAVVNSISDPMARYRDAMIKEFADWQPLEDAAANLLQGKAIDDRQLLPAYRPLVKLMRLIVEVTEKSVWDWASPEVMEVFQEVASGRIYTLFSEVIVEMIISIMQQITIGTLLEVGAGPGKLTADLCQAMATRQLENVPLIISDQSPTVAETATRLRQAYPSFDITDFVWNLREDAPPELQTKIKPPVLVFERFCLAYAGCQAIDTIAPLADIFIIVDDLSLTGQKASYDKIYEKIGSQFLVFEEARKHLEKSFSFIHTCDEETIQAINAPVTSFVMAVKP